MGFGQVTANEMDGWIGKGEFRKKGREGGRKCQMVNQYAERRLTEAFYIPPHASSPWLLYIT